MIKINSVDKSSLIMTGSLQITDEVNARSTGSINILDTTGAYRPVIGDLVQVYNGATLIFAGQIDDLPEKRILGTDAILYNGVPLVDSHQIADRRIVAEVYEAQTAGYIVTDILTNYLADEDITAGTIQAGITISKAVFNYMTASRCFDEISELTGFQWRINADKTFDFYERATFTGTAITESSQIRNVNVKRNRELYRNRQYLRAGQDIALAQTRTFLGDGETTVWAVDLPIALVPTVTVDAGAKTVGIRGLETGFDFYWQKNDKTISQDMSGAKLTSANTLSILYQGFYPIMVVADNGAEIDSRKTVEGGTGLYEMVEDKQSIDTKASALEYTDGLLRRYAQLQSNVSFTTFDSYTAGELITVTLPTHDISEQMLVASVNITDPMAYDGRLEYTVKLVSGESFGGWVNFFKKLTDKNATFTIRENEILVKVLLYSDIFTNLAMTDTMTYTLHQYLICGTTQYCGTGVII